MRCCGIFNLYVAVVSEVKDDFLPPYSIFEEINESFLKIYIEKSVNNEKLFAIESETKILKLFRRESGDGNKSFHKIL